MYRNNLVRATLSVFVACTLLYTASASAQQTLEELPEPESLQITTTIVDSNNLLVGWGNAAVGVTTYELTLIATTENRVAAIQEVSAVDGSEAFAFESIDLMTAYTLRVVAKGDASLYAPSPPYRVIVYQPQLETPMISVIGTNGVNPTVFWSSMVNVGNYTLRLYLGDDTSGQVLDRIEVIGLTSQQYVIVFNDNDPDTQYTIEPLTQYTVELIAQATGYRESNPATSVFVSGKANINVPTRNELRITPSTDNITVTFENTQSGVDGYTLSIQKRFDDLGIAQSMQNFTISDSPITFTDLLPDRAYTLIALPTFESERYQYSGGIVSLDFMTRDTSLRLRLRVFLEGPLQ